MRRNQSLTEAFEQDQDTPTERRLVPWTVMVVALGAAITIAWLGFLLWGAFQLLDWAFG